jgi:hypothetical protein
MKKKFFILCAALVWTVALMAQSIAVVKADGSTTLVRTLDEAIAVVNENDGCVVYLPGGGFSVSDDSKITKKVTIIGIGHKANNDNVDGVTTISGNIFFNEGSDGSALMGCYLTGNARIGNDDSTVNDVLIRYCNLNVVDVLNNHCYGTIVNQNFIRDYISGGGSAIEITNNVCNRISSINGGLVSNNIITQSVNTVWDNPLKDANNSLISKNVFLHKEGSSTLKNCNYNTFNKNLVFISLGATDEELIDLSGVAWSDVFVTPDGANSSSDYHFKEDYKQHESEVGVYADGVKFDKQLAPVPYIVAKRIDEQTDASGKLNVKIRVNAGGEEE